LERVNLPGTSAVIRLHDVEALQPEIIAHGRFGADPHPNFLVGQLEVSGEDCAALETDALDRINCGGATARFQVLCDKALGVPCRGRISCDANKQRSECVTS